MRDTIDVLAGNHQMRTGNRPAFVYLGKKQMEEMKRIAGGIRLIVGGTSCEGLSIASYDDMMILEVNADDHIAVS